MQIGQVKDALGALMFLVAAYVASTRVIHKNVLLAGLALGFFVDLIFTLKPDWHCEDLNEADDFTPKLILFVQTIVFAILVYLNG